MCLDKIEQQYNKPQHHKLPQIGYKVFFNNDSEILGAVYGLDDEDPYQATPYELNKEYKEPNPDKTILIDERLKYRRGFHVCIRVSDCVITIMKLFGTRPNYHIFKISYNDIVCYGFQYDVLTDVAQTMTILERVKVEI